MRNEPIRPSSVAAAITGCAILARLAGGGPAHAAPPAPATSQKVQAAAPAAKQVPPDVLARLEKVGLSPRDPQFSSKLKTLAASTSASFVKLHVMSTTVKTRSVSSPGGTGGAGLGGGLSLPPSGGTGGAGLGGGISQTNSANTRALATSFPVTGTVLKAYDDTPSQLPNPAPISSTHGKLWPGRYFFLVTTNQKVKVATGPGFSSGNVSLSYGCTANLPYIDVVAAAADDPNWSYGLPKLPPSNGQYSYYVSVGFRGFPIGRLRSAQATLSFENVTAPTSLVLQPTPAMVTLAVTISHAPQLTGIGTINPWGSTGLGGANAKLGSPSTARVGGGDWQTQTQGDDLIGVSVGLGPGWTATSTKIASSVSATSPQDLTPDNVWRGASVTTPPVGNDLRTAVHWHYSGVDSLDYTLEWTLSGPDGQRPLLTMAKYGSCDS